MSITREVVYTHGPRFFVEDGETMFAFRIDSTNEIGPRKATQTDAEKHPEAFKSFMAEVVTDEQPAPGKRGPGRPPKNRED